MKKLFLFCSSIIAVFVFSYPLFSFGNFFVENKGQITDFEGNARKDIICYCKIQGYTVYVTENGLSFVKIEKSKEQASLTKIYNPLIQASDTSTSYNITRTDLDIQELINVKPALLDKEGTYFNYYLSHCKDGILNAALFNTLEYIEISEGVSLKLFIRGSKLIISINSIESAYNANNFYNNILKEIKIKGLEKCCSAEFASMNKVSTIKEKNAKVQEFNDKINWSCVIGGNSVEMIKEMDIDSNDNIIIAGYTESENFPSTPGSFQKFHFFKEDGFIAEFSKNHTLVWCTYVGGNNRDEINDLSVSDNNSIVICGFSRSLDFPVSAGAFKNTMIVDDQDAFFGRFSKNGYREFLTLFGGDKADYLNNLAVDNNGSLYITGNTSSNNFPVSSNCINSTLNGEYDGVILKFDSKFNQLFSSYWGGSEKDFGRDIILDHEGNIIICGETFSNDLLLKNEIKAVNELSEGFISKFDKNFNLLWSTLFGGSSGDAAFELKNDSRDNVLVKGFTQSSDIPVTHGALQSNLIGEEDIFILKLDKDGRKKWCTYYGGTDTSKFSSEIFDLGNIAIDKNDNVAVIGTTSCLDLLTSNNSMQKVNRGLNNGYLLILNSDGVYDYSTYIGGSVTDFGSCLKYTDKNQLFIGGTTTSYDFDVKETTYVRDTAYKSIDICIPNIYIIEFEVPVSIIDTCDETGFTFTNFAYDYNLEYTGKARKNENFIRLTESYYNKSGAVWYNGLIPVRNGFMTEFSFRMSGGVNGSMADSSLPGADGFAFVIQNNKPDIIGGFGGKIGYDPIPNSIAIEFDLFSNDDKQIENLNDPNGNHLAVMSLGTAPNSSDHSSGAELGIAANIFELKPNSELYYAKVEYSIVPYLLRVFISKNCSFASKPDLEVKGTDISKLLNLSDGEWAYAGFTSATGSSYQNHDIMSWSFCPKPTDSHQTEVEEKENNEYPNCMVYPNPAGDKLFINTGDSQHTIVSIYNLAGESIRAYQLSNGNTTIDISELPDGLWFARIKTSDGNIFFEKFVKN